MNKKNSKKIILADLIIWAIFSVVVIYDGIISKVITKPTWIIIILLLVASLVLKIIAVTWKNKKKTSNKLMVWLPTIMRFLDLGILLIIFSYYIFFLRNFPLKDMLLIETMILPFVIVAKVLSMVFRKK